MFVRLLDSASTSAPKFGYGRADSFDYFDAGVYSRIHLDSEGRDPGNCLGNAEWMSH